MHRSSLPPHFGQRRFLSWNDQQRARHGGRVQKVSVDAGFTCPNRDGSKGIGGCTFCNNDGFTPSYLRDQTDITRQIDTGLDFFTRRYPNTRHFVAYFQAYSNTYASVDQLRTVYQAALAHPKIDGLVIGTRPDCVPDAVLDYLAELSHSKIVELELGLESCDDATLARVNRGHNFAEAQDAIRRAAARGLQVAAHLMFDLPGESRDSMLAGADKLSALPLTSLKLHQLQVIKHTVLANQWRRDPASVPIMGATDYFERVVDFLERLSPTIAIQRIGSEVPPALKLAPDWNLRLHQLLPQVEALLLARDTWQGRLYQGQ
ncbi:MAG: TIGR01212 family radical SAM protein [Rhodoferax sp.]|nr:TIGR01212 family radical SAM protein [Rhodoferax sp.]